MKKLIVILFAITIFLCLNTSLYAQEKFLLFFDDDEFERETKEYVTRVENDEAKVIDKKYINELIKLAKKDGFLEQISFWVSASGGLKLENDFVDTQYDLRSNDIKNEDNNLRPKCVNNVANNKPGILYDGINDYLENKEYKAEHPLTIILVIKQVNNIKKEAIVDAIKGKTNAIYFKDGNEMIEPLIVESGKKFEAGKIDTLVNLIFVEMNGKDSKVYLNGEDFGSGELTKGNFNGIILGSLGKLSKDYFLGAYIFECGIINMILDGTKRNNLNELLKKNYR